MSTKKIPKQISDTNDNILRKKIWNIINLIQANQLFVHSRNIDVSYTPEGKKKVATKQLPEILTICVLNALVPNSAMLLVGGHGGGKTTLVKLLGRMITGNSLSDIEGSIIRGHPQLTEEKLIGTLRLGELMQGREEVVWRKFVTDFWKIIDELNRLTPYAQDILLSLLAEGKVKYFDEVQDITKFCLFATINPQDVGTFELSEPFLDRFGVSVPISMPTSHDLQIILRGKDEKFSGYDELVQVPQVLTLDELMEIWYQVDKIEAKSEADNFIHAIIREFTLCLRVDKGNLEDLKPGEGLCSGCHFNTKASICNKVASILSVRVAKDLLRYAKAFAWLLGLNKVDINLVVTIAPYVISHRVNYSDRDLNASPYFGDKLQYTIDLIDSGRKRYIKRQNAYEIVEKFRLGEGSEKTLQEIKKFVNNDLIVKLDLFPLVESINNKEYSEIAKEITLAYKKNDIKTLSRIRDELLENIEFPNRGDLINRCNQELYKQTLTVFNFKHKYWQDIWASVEVEFPELGELIKKAFEKRQTKQIRTKDLLIEINVTGTSEDSIINFGISGGSEALKLKELIEQESFIEEIE
jgi:MoxR-like ATPase